MKANMRDAIQAREKAMQNAEKARQEMEYEASRRREEERHKAELRQLKEDMKRQHRDGEEKLGRRQPGRPPFSPYYFSFLMRFPKLTKWRHLQAGSNPWAL